MADERRSGRTPGRPARGSSGPSRTRSSVAPRRTVQQEKEAATAAARASERAEEKQRTRLTGRAAILVLVLAVLAVSYASSLRAYLQQRGQIDALQSQISEREAAIEDLEQEKERLHDPAYVAQQARERFGYVQRGETPYVVVGADGEPLENVVEFTDPESVGSGEEPAWYDDMWSSMKVAGDPPTQIPDPPNERIEPSEEDLAE